MRKGNGTPGIPAVRLCRIPLTVLAVLLSFLLGGSATAPDALPAVALKSAGGQPSVSAAYNADEEDHGKNKSDQREGNRGQPRRTSRTDIGVPQLIGRLLPPYRSDSAPASAPPSARRSAAAASRPLQLPVLNCVFRC